MIKVKDTCLRCGYYNPKVGTKYKCYIRGSCPAWKPYSLRRIADDPEYKLKVDFEKAVVALKKIRNNGAWSRHEEVSIGIARDCLKEINQ